MTGHHPWMHGLFGTLALVALVALALWRSSVGTQLDSLTVDEPWHVVAGTSYVRSGDFRLNPEHPPLVKLWVGAAMPADFTLPPTPALSEKKQERSFVEHTLFLDNDPAAAQARARIAMQAFHGLLLIVLGGLLWRVFGLPWAVATLAFIALEPTLSAHLPVVMTDLPLALTLLVATVTGGLLAATWQWRWAIGCALAIGLALATKHSALAGIGGLALVLLVAAIVGGWRGGWRVLAVRLGKLLAVGVLAITLLWASYGFRFHAAPDGGDGFNRPIAAKIAELKIPVWREAIANADRLHLLPRAWLWGLADTVRTGVEGRGISEHFIWGHLYQGRAPWFSWPAIVVAKLPLALLVLALLGAVLLTRLPLPAPARWTLRALLGVAVFHMAALIVSGSVWGGVRHALPVIAALAVLAGAALALAWQQRSRMATAVVAALLVAAFATTIREPRLWEYHGELVGGTANGHRHFSNEGLDLGQRFDEIRAFYHREIRKSGQPLYLDYWLGDEQIRAGGIERRRRVESLEDDNIAGLYEGWFVCTRSDELPWPAWDWDPERIFRDMQPVARFGHVTIWKGRQERPQMRAGALNDRIIQYLYEDGGSDWALVAKRLEEVVAQMPQLVSAAMELGNAYLRLGDGANATIAYRRPLEQDKVPVDERIATQLREQIAAIAASGDVRQLPLLRNSQLE